MKTHDLVQGSPEWDAFRLEHHGASEAAAMLGLSPYMSRTELLKMKKLGMPREFSKFVQERVLDRGHATEALARPIVESMVGQELYPVTGSLGKLSASCDGLALDDSVAMEHKQLSDELFAAVDAGHVPEHHMPQCQQVLMVTGAAKLLFIVSDGTADRMTYAEVFPDQAWFQRLRDGWAQFDRDLASYVLPEAAAPAPVGKAPETLPALRIEVTGAVTASNLAEWKQTALTTIRSVNRELKTDQDFADAEKAVKWCADVETKLKAAKEHALSQTTTIDALFKAIDDIGAEARAVRLDLDKLVTRRKTEVKEEAVAAARAALAEHIAGLNAELSPHRLQPLNADFAGAIKGLRSIASMQDALDTTLAQAKIAADAAARVVRANAAAYRERATGLEHLFADLGALIHKAPEDFALLVQARVDTHRANEARREAERQAAEAARIAAAEQRAREQEAARIAAEQRQREAAEAEAARQAAAAVAAAAAPAPVKEPLAPAAAPTPAPLLQDQSRPLTDALASKPDAMRNAREAVAAIQRADEPATLKLGVICERLGVTLTAAFLGDTLHIKPAKVEGASKLYTEHQFALICRQLQSHISAMAELYGTSDAAA